jgi:hypothetical protein
MLKKSPLPAFVFVLAAVIETLALLLAFLIWQGAIGMPDWLAYPLAALGIVCFVCVLIFGALMPGIWKPVQEKAFSPPVQFDAPVSGRDFRTPQAQQPTGETILLFDENAGQGYVDSNTVTAASEQGLRLSWEIDGKPHNLERYEFPQIIGRDFSCSLVVNAPSVSRRHAQLTFENNAFYISDLGSSNGILINGTHAEGAARIEDGDEIRLGRINVKVSFISMKAW